jgi:hypothetical protein
MNTITWPLCVGEAEVTSKWRLHSEKHLCFVTKVTRAFKAN